jgi:hypothetical protein
MVAWFERDIKGQNESISIAVWRKSHKAGLIPAGIVATTLLAAVSITDTELFNMLQT